MTKRRRWAWVFVVMSASVVVWLVWPVDRRPLNEVDFEGMPGVARADVFDVSNPRGRIVQLLDYHYVPRELANDVGDYDEYLDVVEGVQASQMATLRRLVDRHGLDVVWMERLTEANLGDFDRLVDAVRGESLVNPW